MKYSDILSLLKTNPRYKFKRKTWNNSYVTMDGQTVVIVSQFTNEKGKSIGFKKSQYRPSFAEIVMHDWEIIEE